MLLRRASARRDRTVQAIEDVGRDVDALLKHDGTVHALEHRFSVLRIDLAAIETDHEVNALPLGEIFDLLDNLRVHVVVEGSVILGKIPGSVL